MGTRDLATIMGVAAATAALILAVCRPALVSAGDEEAGAKRLAGRPSLRVDGVTFTLESTEDVYEVGERPAIELTAVNTASEPRTVNITLRMMTTVPTSPFARMLPLPKEAWRQTCPISLKARERREIPIGVDVALPAGKGVFFTMNAGQPASGSAGARPGAGNKSTTAIMFADPYLTIRTAGGPAKPGGAAGLRDVNPQSVAKIAGSGGK